MKTRWRIVVAALAALAAAGAPALAQDSAPPASPPAQGDVVGPPQLQNFSIQGTVTREAPAPAPVQTQQRPRQGAAESGSAQNAQASASRTAQASREPAASAPRSESQSREEPARRTAEANPPSPAPAPRVTTPAVGEFEETAALSPQPVSIPASTALPLESPGGVPMLPWLIAALALAGAAAWYFLRQRPRERYATAGGIELFEAPSPEPMPAPAPAPPPRTPPPAAAPRPASPGIVSTRLRPWLEIEFKPQRAVIDEEKATVEFELTIFNSGSAPARNVLIEASMFNAGPMQDQEIRRFFDKPVTARDPVPVIAPLQRVTVDTAVVLPRDQLRPIELEGRQLFVPMVAFNVFYGWSGNAGQSSASYLVGKATQNDKLAPFRLDLGPRVFRNLDARESELRLRN